MAPTPPGIPTSFVPRQPVQAAPRRPQSTGANVFLITALILLGAAVAAAAGAFAYQRYLAYQLDRKMDQLAEAQARVNEEQIEEFVRLRDRLRVGNELLSNHVMLSQFFDAIERLTLRNVRFSTLTITVAGDNSAKLDAEGVARNFNSLAAQSNAFAGERGIKRAIFSDITVTESRQVEFRLTADLDPRLVVAGRQGIPDAPADPLTVPVAPAPAPGTTTPSRPGTSTPTTPAR